MMGLDTPETCRVWRNILRISSASSWVFFIRTYRDGRPTKHEIQSNFAVLSKNVVFSWILWIFFTFVIFLRVRGCAQNPVPCNKVLWKFNKLRMSTVTRHTHTRRFFLHIKDLKFLDTPPHVAHLQFCIPGMWMAVGSDEVNIPYRIPQHFDVTYHK